MENMVTAILNQDVYSNFNTKSCKEKYGSKGDEVEIISESYPAMIVKGKNGILFSINQDKVSEQCQQEERGFI